MKKFIPHIVQIIIHLQIVPHPSRFTYSELFLSLDRSKHSCTNCCLVELMYQFWINSNFVSINLNFQILKLFLRCRGFWIELFSILLYLLFKVHQNSQEEKSKEIMQNFQKVLSFAKVVRALEGCIESPLQLLYKTFLRFQFRGQLTITEILRFILHSVEISRFLYHSDFT